MNAETFFENFSLVANADGGIRRIRDLVLFAAITGVLSKPEMGDSNAALIAADSLQAKERYDQDNNVRRSQRKYAELFQTITHAPKHWELLPAGDLVHLINGRAFKSTEWKTSGFPIIRIQNLNDPKKTFNYFQGEVACSHRIENGDMLLSWSGTPGTSFGAFIWDRGEAVLNQHIFKVVIYSKLLDKEYLRMTINACLEALIGSARGGVGLKHVTKGQIEALQIPLPPLEEQKRIVAKVNELMRLCDQLERQQQQRSRLLPLLSRANHARLSETPTPASLAAIFTGPITLSLVDMRKTILALAVSGGLSQHETGDSDAALIAADSLQSKERYDRENGVRRSQRKHVELFQTITHAPKHWALLPAGDLVHLINGRAFKSTEWKTTGLPIIRIQNLNNPEKSFNYFQGDVSKNHQIKTGDMMLSWSGTPGTSFGAFIWENGEAVLNQHIFKVVIFSNLLNKEYLRMTINACLDALIGSARGGVGLKHVTKGQIEALQIPLPGLEEQKRIVKKVDELMKLCDELERQQTEIGQVAESFAKNAISAITGTETQEQHEMKAPKLELVTRLVAEGTPKTTDNALLTNILADSKSEVSAKELWQKSGLEIDAFYSQLKIEMSQGWIAEPKKGLMKEVATN